jgi:hypothetical protein
LYPTTAKKVKLKWFHEKEFLCKMILTHESGSQKDQFDEKKWRQKISWDYPFKAIVPENCKCVLVKFWASGLE